MLSYICITTSCIIHIRPTFNWLLGNTVELYEKYSYEAPFLPSDCVFEAGKLSS